MMIDLSYLKITTNNDKEVILQLVAIFKSQLPDLKENLVNAYNNKEWIILKSAAHKAKTSFKIMGLEKGSENLRQIELECAKTDNINCDENIKFFLSEYDNIFNEIDTINNELSILADNQK